MLFHLKCGKRTLREEAVLLAQLFQADRIEEHESLHVAGGEYYVLRASEYEFSLSPEDTIGLSDYRFELAIYPKGGATRTLAEEEELHLALMLRVRHQRVVRWLTSTRRQVVIVVYRKRAGVLVAEQETIEL